MFFHPCAVDNNARFFVCRAEFRRDMRISAAFFDFFLHLLGDASSGRIALKPRAADMVFQKNFNKPCIDDLRQGIITHAICNIVILPINTCNRQKRIVRTSVLCVADRNDGIWFTDRKLKEPPKLVFFVQKPLSLNRLIHVQSTPRSIVHDILLLTVKICREPNTILIIKIRFSVFICRRNDNKLRIFAVSVLLFKPSDNIMHRPTRGNV